MVRDLIKAIICICALFLISSCSRETVEFNSNDPRIIRGDWRFTITGLQVSGEKSVIIPFTATYQDEERYRFSGPFALPEIGMWRIEGEMIGGKQLRFTTQSASDPIFGVDTFVLLKFLDSTGQEMCYFQVCQPGGAQRYVGKLAPVGDRRCFGLRVSEGYTYESLSATLERVN